MFPNDPNLIRLWNTVCEKCETVHFIKAGENYCGTHKCKKCGATIEISSNNPLTKADEIVYKTVYANDPPLNEVRNELLWKPAEQSRFSGTFILSLFLIAPAAILIFYLGFCSGS